MIEIHPEAEKEYFEALLYYKEKSPKAAQMFADEFESILFKISAFPSIGIQYKNDFRKFSSI
ncbi:MAG: type II toxin-antitoxin system RelE/ParE family toxin [Chloroherpetonaceae bacterium]|nr:type II toxin-antitoxin system RelE/ParE family toxin [Chloroherpetonaceae bacterium]